MRPTRASTIGGRHQLTAPLSFQQEAIWYAGKPATFTIPPMVVRLRGALDRDALHAAVQRVVNRHDMLRTRFHSNGERAAAEQVIDRTIRVHLEYGDLRGIDEHDLLAASLRYVGAQARAPFDLRGGPLMRAGILRLGADDHLLWFVVHHIAADLWSMKVLLRDVSQSYSDCVGRKPDSLAPLPIQYTDYAWWQRAWLERDELIAHLDYWHRQLDGAETLSLPQDKKDDGPATTGLATMLLSSEVSAALRKVAAQQRVTPFMLLLSAFFALLHAYSGQDDILVDSSLANRDFLETESIIGMFSTTMSLRGRFKNLETFQSLLCHVRDQCFVAYEHRHLTFRRATALLAQQGRCDGRVQPRVLFAMQKAPVETGTFAGLTAIPVNDVAIFEETAVDTPRWDQMWQVWERGPRFQVLVFHKSTAFTPMCVQGMLASFDRIAEAIATTNPEALPTASLAALIR